MRLWVDPYRCVGHLTCCDQAPELFEFDDERGLAYASDEPVPPELAAAAQAAVRLCPEKAILTLEDQ